MSCDVKKQNVLRGKAAVMVCMAVLAAATLAINLHCYKFYVNTNFRYQNMDTYIINAVLAALFVFVLPVGYLMFCVAANKLDTAKNKQRDIRCFVGAAVMYAVIYPKLFSTFSIFEEISKHILNFAYAYMIINGFYRRISTVRSAKNKFRFYLPAAAGLLFTLLMYLPLDSYMNACTDFMFTADILIYALCICFAAFFILASVLLVIMDKNILKYTVILLSALNFCVYIQYMFMNGNLSQLDGTVLNIKDNIGFGAVNLIIWAAVIILFFVLYKKSDKAKNIIVFILPKLLLGIQFISLLISLVFLPSAAWKVNALYFSGSDQFTLAPGKNIVVLVWDALDNDYIKKIKEESPELLEKFDGFTVYTNTCSVFDTTNLSLSQMFACAEFDNTLTAAEFYEKAWLSEKNTEFYKRLHDKGYKALFFNPKGCRAEYLIGKADNVYSATDEETKQYKKLFNETDIAKYFLLVAQYRALPFFTKGLVDINGFGSDRLKAGNVNMNAIYSNTDFENALSLKIDKNWENALVIQHLVGTHDGDTPEHCLKITLDYIEELKRLGIYENTDIIITADHGKHGNEGSTPMFMIRRRGESGEIKFNNAPIYHEDIKATLLTLADCYYPNKDEAVYGKNIFAFDEDTKRERIWYDKFSDPNYPKVNEDTRISLNIYNYNVFYKYVYTGDTEELNKKVDSGVPDAILPMKEYY